MNDDQTHKRRIRRELAFQLIGLGATLVGVALIDPVQRRDMRLAWLRLQRSLLPQRGLPRLPAPWEITALHEEARRITREAP